MPPDDLDPADAAAALGLASGRPAPELLQTEEREEAKEEGLFRVPGIILVLAKIEGLFWVPGLAMFAPTTSL